MNKQEALEFFEKWSDKKHCLEEVKQSGDALRYVKIQTPEVVLAAVTQSGYALQFVKIQTPEVILAAVTQDGYALRYVRDRKMLEEIIKKLKIK